MQTNPSSINADFNKEFREIYSILQSLNLQAKSASKSDDKLAKAIYAYAKTFSAFAEKYKKHADNLSFEPETLASIKPSTLVAYAMNDLYATSQNLTEFEALESELKSLLSL